MEVLTDDQARANISKNVRLLRGGRSLYWLAKAAKTHPINISRIESGKSMPGAGMLARLAEALDTSTDALLSLDAARHARELQAVV